MALELKDNNLASGTILKEKLGNLETSFISKCHWIRESECSASHLSSKLCCSQCIYSWIPCISNGLIIHPISNLETSEEEPHCRVPTRSKQVLWMKTASQVGRSLPGSSCPSEGAAAPSASPSGSLRGWGPELPDLLIFQETLEMSVSQS